MLGGALTFGCCSLARRRCSGGAGPAATALAAAVAVAAALAEARGRADRAADPPPAAGALAPRAADAARGRPLRDPARPRLHDLRAELGVWALAGISLALGDPARRAADRRSPSGRPGAADRRPRPARRSAGGRAACEAMAVQPGLLRRAARRRSRCSLARRVPRRQRRAEAARKEVPKASDPVAAGTALAYERNNGAGELRRADGAHERLPGPIRPTGGPWIARRRRRTGSWCSTAQRSSRRAPCAAAGADAVAVSPQLARVPGPRRGATSSRSRRWSDGGAPGRPRLLARAKRPAQLSRAGAVDGNALVVAVAKRGQEQARPLPAPQGRQAEAQDAARASRTRRSPAPRSTGKDRLRADHPRRQSVRVKGFGRARAGRSIAAAADRRPCGRRRSPATGCWSRSSSAAAPRRSSALGAERPRCRTAAAGR